MAAGARPRRSLRAVVFVVVTAVVLIPVGLVAVLDLATESADARMRLEVDHAAHRVAALARTAGTGARGPGLEAIAERFGVRLRIIDGDEPVVREVDRMPRQKNTFGVASTLGAEAREQIARDEARRSDLREDPLVRTAREAGLAQRCEAAAGGRVLRCQTVVRVDTREGRWLVVAEKRAVRSLQRLVDVKRPLLLLGAVTAVAGLLLAWWLVRRLVRPLHDLRGEVVARAAEARTATRPVELAAPREIDDVVRSFNTLLGVLQEQRQATESFVADLAHELKGPLAALRTSSELLGSEELAPEAREQMTRSVAASVLRIDATVAELLELARAEAGLPQEQREALDLGALCRGAGELFFEEEVAGGEGPRPVIDTPDAPVMVQAAPGQLSRAVRNLLQNAVAHARDEVRLSVKAEGASVVVEVADDGPGIAREDLPRLFERFFSRREGGTGLGLALVRAIAEAHGGTTEARNEGGARLQIRLPRITG